MYAVHIDYETRSAADLEDVGGFRYAVDPSTEIFMASVSDGVETVLWINPKFQFGEELGENAKAERILAEADLIYAHSVASFELPVTHYAIERGAACPFKTMPDISKWRCTAAMARRAALPPSLKKLAEALQLDVKKDSRGDGLIRFFSIPDDDGKFNEPRDNFIKWVEFCNYCLVDNVVEQAVHQKLIAFELTGAPLDTFQFDLRMNLRGIPVNVKALQNASKIVEQLQSGVTAEFRKLTGLNPTQNKKVKAWVNALGIPLMNLKADTLEEMMEQNKFDLVPLAKEAMQLYSKVSYAAVKKIDKMLDWVCPDGRMRGVLTYHGAGTGRWTAGGPQIQNAKKTTPELRPYTDQVFRYIEAGGTREGLELVYEDVLEMISCCVRHFVGNDILDGDYNAIEARIIPWLAGQWDVLEMWKAVDAGDKSRHPYKVMAALIYNIPVDQVTEDQREVGKRAILGLGFQMGEDKFKASSLEMYGVDLTIELCRTAKYAFRNLNDKIVAYWYILDGNAKMAVKQPGSIFGAFHMRKIAGIPYLLFKLRSGRSLAYPYPAIENRDPTKEERAEMEKGKTYPPDRFKQLTYWGQIPGKAIWGRIKLYGGKLAENETQATAADFMAYGAIEAERQGMAPFALIHDQGLGDRVNNHTADEFSAALATLPSWAKGFPLRVEAKVSEYYKK